MPDRIVQYVPAERRHERILWRMLTYAASMGAETAAAIEQARADPYLRCYVEGWGTQAGDLGVIARSDSGADLGAAWLRLGGDGGRFKLGDRLVPELATAVVPEARGQGIGTAMMTHLIESANGRFPEIVLSVRESNPAAGFYRKLGFRETGRMENRVGGASIVMRLELHARA
jgi:ribosomal protein S18 acetylase RimI-like enzyme